MEGPSRVGWKRTHWTPSSSTGGRTCSEIKVKNLASRYPFWLLLLTNGALKYWFHWFSVVCGRFDAHAYCKLEFLINSWMNFDNKAILSRAAFPGEFNIINNVRQLDVLLISFLQEYMRQKKKFYHSSDIWIWTLLLQMIAGIIL